MMANEFACHLRRDMTDAEHCLSRHVRAHRFASERFRRQEPIVLHVVEFVSHRSRLIIELDGGQHAVLVEYDGVRTGWLETRGYRVGRFWNDEVMTQTESVLEAMALALAPSA
jgi:very-short-patch-repair endonuclease